MNIPLAAEEIFSIGGFPITNAVILAVIVTIIIAIVAMMLRVKLSYANPGKFQIVVESLVQYLYNLVGGVMGDAKAKTMFGFVFTFFVFVLFSNLLALTPLVPSTVVDHGHHGEEGEIADDHEELEVMMEEAEHADNSVSEEDEHATKEVSFSTCWETKECVLTTGGVKIFEEKAHVFRAPASDINMPLALALISVITTNVLGFKYLGFGYIKKYISFKGPIEFIVGILEIVSELGKIISFAFRLFGNIFAGEVLLVILTGISVGAATLPFLMFELFVAIIQAFVFFMLTTMFIGLATTHHDH